MPYKNVQFIAYCINTAPKKVEFNKNSGEWTQEYLGLKDPKEDIKKRVELVRTAIETAKKESDNNSTTLKIFMIPEFFFRGATGAYELTVEDADEPTVKDANELSEYDYLLEKLQDLVKDSSWKDWIFVFGTIVAKSSNKKPEHLKKDDPEPPEIDEAYNVSVVQKGGFGDLENASDNANVAIVMKEHKSTIDFIKDESITGTSSGVVFERVIYPLTVNENKPNERKELFKKFMNLEKKDLDEPELKANAAEKLAYQNRNEKKDSMLAYINSPGHTVLHNLHNLWSKYLKDKNALLNKDKTKRDELFEKFMNLGEKDLTALKPNPAENRAYRNRNEKKDLMLTYINSPGHTVLQHLKNLWPKYLKYKKADNLLNKDKKNRKELSEKNFAGTSIFEMSGIKFGLEVCVDHAQKRLKKSQEYKKGGRVDIQLIPSCGIDIDSKAIAVSDGGYIFNCDGFSEKYKRTFENKGRQHFIKGKDKKPRYSSHSALLMLIKKENSLKIWNKPKQVKKLNIDKDVSELYPITSGQLHIYRALPLPSQKVSGLSLSQSHFPHTSSQFTTSLSSEPVRLNGMKVIFDQATPVYPVTLQPKNK